MIFLFFTVKILDDKGRLCPEADNLIRFKVEGPGEIVAVGNGNPASTEPFVSDKRRAFNGMCLVVIRSLPGETGMIKVSASSDDLQSSLAQVESSNATPKEVYMTSNE